MLKGQACCTRGNLMFKPGCRGRPLTLPKVVITDTSPAGTMNSA